MTLKEILQDYAGREVESSESLTALGLDSFAVISMVCTIEDTFGIKIKEEDIPKLILVEDLEKLVENG